MKNTIFDYINAVLHSKDNTVFSNVDDESTFSAYMINRWISMYSPEMANLVNQTTNKYTNIFNTKQDQFNFFVSVYPRLRQKRIPYVKKAKTEKVKEDEEADLVLALIAKNRECSQREIKMFKEMVAIIEG